MNKIKGIEVVFPSSSKGSLSCANGTKFYLGSIELEGVSAFSMPHMYTNSILEVTLTFPLMSVSYADQI